MNATEILYSLEKNLHEPQDILWLGDVYSNLIDCRLHLFRNEHHWAIVTERLGYSQKAGSISLEIQYFGNCISPIGTSNGEQWDQYAVRPITFEAMQKCNGEGFSIKKGINEIKVRDTMIPISQDRAKYKEAGIPLMEDAAEIGWESVGRHLVLNHANLFRATERELYKYLPKDLEKILVLNEWHHKDYEEVEELANVKSSNVAHDYLDRHGPFDTYETYPLLAEVLASGDRSLYEPMKASNNHWMHWPESGSL